MLDLDLSQKGWKFRSPSDLFMLCCFLGIQLGGVHLYVHVPVCLQLFLQQNSLSTLCVSFLCWQAAQTQVIQHPKETGAEAMYSPRAVVIKGWKIPKVLYKSTQISSSGLSVKSGAGCGSCYCCTSGGGKEPLASLSDVLMGMQICTLEIVAWGGGQ